MALPKLRPLVRRTKAQPTDAYLGACFTHAAPRTLHDRIQERKARRADRNAHPS